LLLMPSRVSLVCWCCSVYMYTYIYRTFTHFPSPLLSPFVSLLSKVGASHSPATLAFAIPWNSLRDRELDCEGCFQLSVWCIVTVNSITTKASPASQPAAKL
jgi:hypothetical protein